MSFRSALFITATLAAASIVVVPLSAQAGGMSRVGTYGGKAGNVAIAPGGPNCKQGAYKSDSAAVGNLPRKAIMG